VRARAGRQHLEDDLGLACRGDQPADLLAHHRGPADRPGEHALVDDHPQQRRCLPGQDRLPVQPDTDQPVHLAIGRRRVRRGEHRPGIVLGLQQPGDQQRLEPAQRGRLALDLHPVTEPGRVGLGAHERLQPGQQPAGAQRLVGAGREVKAGRPAPGLHVRDERGAVRQLLGKLVLGEPGPRAGLPQFSGEQCERTDLTVTGHGWFLTDRLLR